MNRGYCCNSELRILPARKVDERLQRPPYADRSIQHMVHRHAQRALLSTQTSLAEAERLKQRLVLAVACDPFKGESLDNTSTEMRKQNLCRSILTRIDYLPTTLSYYRGMC